jgi:hypothetical protein
MWSWIDRQGGMLVAPRQTLAALSEQAGPRDGTWVLVVYLLAAHVDGLFAALARVVALHDFDALLRGVVDVALGLVVPFVTSFAVELVLGRARAHRAALCLAPMLAVAALLHLLDAVGVLVWPTPWLPGAISALPALAYAVWLRPSIAPRSEAVSA